MSKHNFKTTNIKGKEYVEVNERIKFFRTCADYKGFSLLSEIVAFDDAHCIVKATITDAEGKHIANGYAHEVKAGSMINKTSMLENCETSAWGRALGNLGIGIDTSIATYEEVSNAIEQQKGNLKAPPASNAGTGKWKDILPLLTTGTDKQKETLAKMLSSSQCNDIIADATGDWANSKVDVIKAVGLFLKLTVGQTANRYALAVAMSFYKDDAIVAGSIKSINEGKKSGKDALTYFTNLKDK